MKVYVFGNLLIYFSIHRFSEDSYPLWLPEIYFTLRPSVYTETLRFGPETNAPARTAKTGQQKQVIYRGHRFRSHPVLAHDIDGVPTSVGWWVNTVTQTTVFPRWLEHF